MGEQISDGANTANNSLQVTEESLNRIISLVKELQTGEKIKEYESVTQAEQDIQVRIENIGEINKSCGNLCFLYHKDTIGKTEKELVDFIHSLYPYLVYQLDLQGNIIALYRNTAEASLKTNISQGNIIECCNNNRRLTFDFQWCYQKDLKDKLNKSVRDIYTSTIPITQYNLSGLKIKQWDSATQIKKELNISDSHINQCCRLKRKTAGGYQWRYSQDNIKSLVPITNRRPVICIETQELFDTCNKAAKHFNYSQQTVKKSCLGQSINKPLHFKWADEVEVTV